MQKSCGLTTPRLEKYMQISSMGTNTHSKRTRMQIFSALLKKKNKAKKKTHHFSSSETIVGLKEKKQVSVTDGYKSENRHARLAASSSPLPFK